jgi:hypothetical protein
MDTLDTNASKTQVARGDEDPREKRLPPALVESIMEDPTSLQPLARMYTANMLHEMYKESSAYTPAQKQTFTELCAKLGALEPNKQQATNTAGPGYQLIINLGDTTETHRSITVEHAPIPVEDTSDASV